MGGTAVAVLARTAAKLGRAAARRNPSRRPIPSLFFLTDPARTPHPAQVMVRLPAGSAVIYRAFGSKEAITQGLALRQLARRRRLVFLVGADSALAQRLDADGVHLPERLLGLAPRLRQAHPGWLITTAAHGPKAVATAARLKLDAALVSAVFASASRSAGPPLGAVRFAALVRKAQLPVIALGGIDASTANRLMASGAAGLAAIGGLATEFGQADVGPDARLRT